MAVGDANVFPGFLTPELTQLYFPKPPTSFIRCFCRGERRKYARKNRLNRGSNSQPPGHGSDMLTTEPPGWGKKVKKQGKVKTKIGLHICPDWSLLYAFCKTRTVGHRHQVSKKTFNSKYTYEWKSLGVKEFHRSAAILAAVFETVSRRKSPETQFTTKL